MRVDRKTLDAIRVLQREAELVLEDHGEVLEDGERREISEALDRIREVFGPRSSRSENVDTPGHGTKGGLR